MEQEIILNEHNKQENDNNADIERQEWLEDLSKTRREKNEE